MSSPKGRMLVAQLAFQKIKDLEFGCIGGLEIGAIAIATTISDYAFSKGEFEWRTFVVRKQAKEHGLRKLIEGVNPPDRALIVDDVLTTGGSVLKAVRAAREFGLTVEHALVIVDRGEKNGRQNIEKDNVNVLSLLTIKDFQSILEPALR
jgi:orotate phosphoribosyltransferase